MSQLKAVRIPKYLKRWLPYLSTYEFWILVSLYQHKYFLSPESKYNNFSVQVSNKKIAQWSGVSLSTIKKVLDGNQNIMDMISKENQVKHGSNYIDANLYHINLKLTPLDTQRILGFLIDEKISSNYESALEKLEKNIWKILEFESYKVDNFDQSLTIEQIIRTFCNLDPVRTSNIDIIKFSKNIENKLFTPYHLIPFSLQKMVLEKSPTYATLVYFIRSCGYANYSTGEFRNEVYFEKSHQSISAQTGIPLSSIKNLLSKNKEHIIYKKKGIFQINFNTIDQISLIDDMDVINQLSTTENQLDSTEDIPTKNTVENLPYSKEVPEKTNLKQVILTKNTVENQLKKQNNLIKNTKSIKYIQHTNQPITNESKNIKNVCVNRDIDKKIKLNKINHTNPTETTPYLKQIKQFLISEYHGYKQKFVSEFPIEILLAYRLYLATNQGVSVGYGWVITELQKGMPFLDSTIGKRCLELASQPKQLEKILIEYLEQGEEVDDKDPFRHLYYQFEGNQSLEEIKPFDSVLEGSFKDLKKLLNSIYAIQLQENYLNS